MVKALIIDDNSINIELLEAYLSLYQIETIGSESGQQGFSIARDIVPDVIFMDLLMPDHSWNGYQATLALKQDKLTKHIPIVAVSGGGDMELADDAGCDYFLLRPFNASDIAQILQQMNIIGV